jgi:hypothetical protein
MTDTEKTIKDRVDAAMAEAKTRMFEVPEQAQKVAIQFIPQADQRTRLYTRRHACCGSIRVLLP